LSVLGRINRPFAPCQLELVVVGGYVQLVAIAISLSVVRKKPIRAHDLFRFLIEGNCQVGWKAYILGPEYAMVTCEFNLSALGAVIESFTVCNQAL